MKVLVSFGFSLLLATSVWAGNYTVITTAEQDVALAWRLKVINAERAAQNPPLEPLTEVNLMQQIWDQVLVGIQANLEDEAAKMGQKAWPSLSPTDQQVICDKYRAIGKPLPVCP